MSLEEHMGANFSVCDVRWERYPRVAENNHSRAWLTWQSPFLAVAPRLAGRAVKGAPFAFTGAKRKPLTEEAHGLGAGFCQEGKRREDREANDDGAKQQNEDGVAERGIAADVAE